MCGILCLIRYNTPIDLTMAHECLEKLTHRGPDKGNYVHFKVAGLGLNKDKCEVYMGFRRLSIMDTSDAGLQPFSLNEDRVICNGEIYDYKALASKYEIDMKSECDCEIILPLHEKLGFANMLEILDAEFAMTLFDRRTNTIYAARDRYGVRPLFVGWNMDTKMIGFASEAKALHNIMEYIEPLQPQKYVKINLNTMETGLNLYEYYHFNKSIASDKITNVEYIHNQIHDLFTKAVKKRLYADKPIGFLLSGGLDSSLVVSVATKILGANNIVCFSIGVENSPDVEAAKKVVEFLGIKNHHIIPFDIEIGISTIPDVIQILESYDITTIRASTPQYLMAKYIREYTDIKVLLTGEGSDEINGSYRYHRDAPNDQEFHKDTVRLLEELYMFDNLRTDRTMASNGLEVRVPYLDFEFVELIMKIDPKLKMFSLNNMSNGSNESETSIEKQLLRDSFKGYLPNEILYRSKEAFSDAVSSKEINWFKSIQIKAAETISDNDVKENPFKFNTPQTIDALYFRRIFNEIYPERDNLIAHYWLPQFQKDNVFDPSATILKSY